MRIGDRAGGGVPRKGSAGRGGVGKIGTCPMVAGGTHPPSCDSWVRPLWSARAVFDRQPFGCMIDGGGWRPHERGTVRMDEVFKALADPSRRLLLDSLNDRNGQTLRELCGCLSMARQSVSKHLAVLETANLVTTVRQGREKLHYVNAEPVVAIADRWIDRYDAARLQTLAELTTVLESPAMAGEFSYTTYIRTTPERLWQAITNPAFSRDYLGHAIESEWQKGSSYVWLEAGLRIEDPEQVIVESDPYQRLAFTFHAVTPELRQIAPDLSEETIAQAPTEPRSRVSFDIEPVGDQVKLTLTHDGFGPGSPVREMISHGWPLKLSSLKSGLEQID